MGESIKKIRPTYTMEYYSAFKNKDIVPFATTWMNLEKLYIKQNKPGTERQVVNDLTHMWNLQKVISEVQGKMVCTFPYFLTSTNARENLASYHP